MSLKGRLQKLEGKLAVKSESLTNLRWRWGQYLASLDCPPGETPSEEAIQDWAQWLADCSLTAEDLSKPLYEWMEKALSDETSTEGQD